MKAIGPHQRTSMDGKDTNGRFMVTCQDCATCAHARGLETAEADLAGWPCINDCENCNRLRSSSDRNPAVPIGGTSHTELHVCPNDGRWWWQGNTHFHHWQQITNHKEWMALQRQNGNHVGPRC